MAMIGLAVRLLSLCAALLVTSGAVTALATDLLPPEPRFLCDCGPPNVLYTFGQPVLKPPPPLPEFLHPARLMIKPPDIVCEAAPNDPSATTDCGAPTESE